jgi:hypothetical protein
VTTVVCIGAGIVGIYAALRMRRSLPSARILLVEQDDQIGGLLRSDLHPNGLYYDRGTHILSETGVPEIDSLLFDGLAADEWHEFAGPLRDLSGLMIDEAVMNASPFLDASCIPDAVLQVKPATKLEAASTLHALLVRQHGRSLAEAVFRQPLYNLYQRDLEELDPFVANQLPLGRVVWDDLATWLQLCDDDDYRARIACPDQRRLPERYASPLKAFYPRQMGVGRLFTQLGRKLEAAGVELRTSTAVSSIERRPDDAIACVTLRRGDGEMIVADEDLRLVWAATPFPLLGLLGARRPETQFQPGWRAVLVDFRARLRKPLSCYYYIDYGAGDGFRLTNYSALSAQAATQEAAPFTYELWWRSETLDEAAVHRFVAQRFCALGLICQAGDIVDIRLRSTSQSVLLPTMANMASLRQLAANVDEAQPRNMINIGLLSRPNLFFTGDMLRNAEERLVEALG